MTKFRSDCCFPIKGISHDLPIGDHPGAFGFRRKHHIHEGIDLYAPKTAPIYAISTGTIVAIYQFTGERIGMPWWNDTFAIAVADETGTWVYGEVSQPLVHKVGDTVEAEKYLAQLTPVLKVDKGRPMTMLHLERWKPNYGPHTFLWQLDQPQPEFLLDPTPLLLEIK
jgi:hypothetical protein